MTTQQTSTHKPAGELNVVGASALRSTAGSESTAEAPLILSTTWSLRACVCVCLGGDKRPHRAIGRVLDVNWFLAGGWAGQGGEAANPRGHGPEVAAAFLNVLT